MVGRPGSGRKPSGKATTGAQRMRRHRAGLKAAAPSPNRSPLLPPSPPGDDFAERQGAIKTSDELIEELKTVTATLMPPAPDGEDAKARLWHRLGLERAISVVERHRTEIKDVVR
jgi:hypothetical protein